MQHFRDLHLSKFLPKRRIYQKQPRISRFLQPFDFINNKRNLSAFFYTPFSPASMMFRIGQYVHREKKFPSRGVRKEDIYSLFFINIQYHTFHFRFTFRLIPGSFYLGVDIISIFLLFVNIFYPCLPSQANKYILWKGVLKNHFFKYTIRKHIGIRVSIKMQR